MFRTVKGKSLARWCIVVISTLVTLTVTAAIYEIYKNYRYEKWKTYYKEKGHWYGKLTVPSDNPRLMWEYRPYGEYKGRKGRYSIVTNRYGFRSPDKDLSLKDPSTKRIAFLGDSATVGLFVNYEDTFVSRFEYYASRNCRKAPVEALNCAVDGYHTLQLLELLKAKVLKLSPDSVVYVMHLNDFDFEFSSSEKILFFKKPSSFLLTDIRNTLWPIFYDYYEYSFRRNEKAVFNAVGEMSQILRNRNIEFSVVVLPVFSRKAKDFSTYRRSKVHQRIGEVLSRENIRSMDLLHSFKNEKERPGVFARDVWHLNPKGHDYVARKIVPFVLGKECSEKTSLRQ